MMTVQMAASEQLVARIEDLRALFDDRYGDAPWHESPQDNARQVQHMIEEAGRPDTRTAVAVSDTRVVGTAQGALGTTFLDDLRAVDGAAAAALLPPVFELRQLVVAHAVSGRGLGRRLHDVVMEHVRSPALLLTHPDAGEALALYARRDWRLLAHTSFGPAYPRVILGWWPEPHAARLADQSPGS